MRLWVAVFACIFLLETAPSAPAIAATKTAVPLVCTVSGAKLMSGALSSEAICNKIATGLSRAIGKPVHRVTELSPSTRKSGRWLSANIRLIKPATASTLFSHRLNGRTNLHPEFSISVSDRDLDASVIDQIVLELSKKVKG
jgi:hypothetical protein